MNWICFSDDSTKKEWMLNIDSQVCKDITNFYFAKWSEQYKVCFGNCNVKIFWYFTVKPGLISMLNATMTKLIELVREDEDREVALSVLESINEMLKSVGVLALRSVESPNVFLNLVRDVLQRKVRISECNFCYWYLINEVHQKDILWYSDWLHNTTSAGNSIFVTNHNTTSCGRSIMQPIRLP